MSIDIQIAIWLAVRSLGRARPLGCYVASSVRPFRRSAGRWIDWVAVGFFLISIWPLIWRCRPVSGAFFPCTPLDTDPQVSSTMRPPLRAVHAFGWRLVGDCWRFGGVTCWPARPFRT